MSSKRSNKKVNLERSLDQSFRLKKILPLNDTQSDVFDSYYEDYNLFLYGSAGTGKSLLSLFLSLKEILNPNSPYHKVYIIRSSVPSRDMGFMPGHLQEKMAVYESPYVAMVNDLFGRGDAYQIATQKHIVELLSTSFLRGTTFDNCILLCDEIQNYSFSEANTVMTRIGKNCRVIFCGDLNQSDLNRSRYDISGFGQFFNIIKTLEEFDCIEFTVEDVVRSGIVKSYLIAKDKLERLAHDDQVVVVPIAVNL